MIFPVRYNHVGYAPDASKVFYWSGANSAVFPRKFKILTENGESAYEGTFENPVFCEYSGMNVFKGDFSALTQKGKYRIQVEFPENSEKSVTTEPFEVTQGWVSDQFHANVKSFYFQRSGMELPAEIAGKWARPASHLDNHLAFHPCMEREGFWDAHGGWYDAGDYGKYIVNGGVSVATLMIAAEFLSNQEKSSLNKTALLDEIRYELEFFLRMQDTDGGVFFKVSPVHWDGFMTPAESDAAQARRILGKSTTSTLNFAGAMAQAHRVYADVDPKFAAVCLEASLKAYNWAVSRPIVDWPHNTEGSGGYGDDDPKDEFFWTRAMIYREEGNLLDLESRLSLDMDENPPLLGLDWRATQNLGWYALAFQVHHSGMRDRARKALEQVADRIVSLAKEDAYGLSIRRFIWGSNGDVSNHALTLLLVHSWNPKPEYKKVAQGMLDYIYGRNPVSKCFVTGAGWNSPMFPHHRISHSDGVEDPIPGLLVGGINDDRQDMHRDPHYPGTLPGYAYTDERCSFASNETAINWNAPLTTVLALFCL